MTDSRSLPLQSARAVLEAEVRRLFGVPEEAVLDELSEPLRTYVVYALSTVERGRATMQELLAYGPLEGRRFLDVGCAYGGFLAAASEAGAREVAGIDIDMRLVRIAQRFLGELGVPFSVEQGDATDPSVFKALGSFDVITCNDVVEHVADVPACIANLAATLSPGGRAHVAIPNRLSPMWIRSDPHFQLFGIVLLSRDAAQQYKRLAHGNEHYDVGDYFPFPVYENWFKEHGLTVGLANAPADTSREAIEALRAEFSQLVAAAASFGHEKLPSEMSTSVSQAVGGAAEEFERRALEALAQQDSPGEISRQLLLRDYGVPVWNVIASRSHMNDARSEDLFTEPKARAAQTTCTKSVAG